MKSAYELAMERLQKQSPTVTLTETQRAEIAELDSLYKAKIAEREVFLQSQIAQANAFEKIELQDQLAREIRRLTEECESKKEKARSQG